MSLIKINDNLLLLRTFFLQQSVVSHFSTTLSRLMSNYTQAEVAAASGIARSTIANYALGNVGITVGALGQLLQAFPQRDDQLALVRAHLLDEIPADAYGEIDVEPRVSGAGEEAPPAPWAKDVDGAIELLRVRAMEDEDVRRLVLDLEKVLR